MNISFFMHLPVGEYLCCFQLAATVSLGPTHIAMSRATQLEGVHFLNFTRYAILFFNILIQIYILMSNESKFPLQVVFNFFKCACKMFYHCGLILFL